MKRIVRKPDTPLELDPQTFRAVDVRAPADRCSAVDDLIVGLGELPAGSQYGLTVGKAMLFARLAVDGRVPIDKYDELVRRLRDLGPDVDVRVFPEPDAGA